VVKTIKEARLKAEDMLNSFHQPIIAESYIPGRELAVSVLEGPKGLEVLPPLEWNLSEQCGFLTEAFKLTEPAGERQDAVRSVMPDDLLSQLKDLVRQAFKALNLRDYARFDLRLSNGGTFYFLEANVTPSLEPLEALALSAKWAGLDYPSLVDRMLASALDRYGSTTIEGETKMTLGLPTGSMELFVPQGVHTPPLSTIQLAGLLDIQPEERVMELGCGTGILSIAAAKLGAKHVVAIDIDTKALEATIYNAWLNSVDKQIEVRFGSWYEATGLAKSTSGKRKRYDAIIATPPQTPGPLPFGPRYGGPDGTKHLFSIIDGAPDFLTPHRGRLWLLGISLANIKAILQRLKERFEDVIIIHQTERSFTSDEYESIEPGLFEYLVQLRSAGLADFKDIGGGRHIFYNFFIRASGAKKL
jgi:methylase of polypeptide subunit release factors